MKNPSDRETEGVGKVFTATQVEQHQWPPCALNRVTRQSRTHARPRQLSCTVHSLPVQKVKLAVKLRRPQPAGAPCHQREYPRHLPTVHGKLQRAAQRLVIAVHHLPATIFARQRVGQPLKSGTSKIATSLCNNSGLQGLGPSPHVKLQPNCTARPQYIRARRRRATRLSPRAHQNGASSCTSRGFGWTMLSDATPCSLERILISISSLPRT